MDSLERARSRARRGRPSRVEQVAARRRGLLDAAGAVFKRDGYTAASVDSIAEEAGLTKGAVYSQFASKADLFLTLLEERIRRRAADHDAATQQPLDRDTAIEFIKAATAVSRDDPQWHFALLEFRLVAARDPELNARYARAHDVAIAGIVRSLAPLYEGAGVAPPFPLDVLARASLAMEAGALLESVVTDESASEQSAELATAFMAHVLGLPDPAALRSENE